MVEMTQWLQNYLRYASQLHYRLYRVVEIMMACSENTRDFTETDLWDIWFTGNPTGIEEASFVPSHSIALLMYRRIDRQPCAPRGHHQRARASRTIPW